MLFAVAAIASVSCQKEDHIAPAEPVTLTFTSANPETKTEWNEENQTIWWSEKDKIRVACTADGKWQDGKGDVAEGEDAKFYESAGLKVSEVTAKFVVPTDYKKENVGEKECQFYAVYPSSAVKLNFKASVADVTIPSLQTSTLSFPNAADILYGKSVEPHIGLPESSISMSWNRLVAHAYITLKGINGIAEKETINSITLTAQEGAALTGEFNLNVATDEFTADATSNVVTVNCTDIVADASGNVTFWACINPCTITSLDITVETDVATYTCSKSGFSREFLQNKRNILPVDMSGATRTEKEVEEVTGYYVKVTETPADGDWSGTYLLVCEGTNEIMGPMDEDCFVAVEYEILENKIPRTAKTTAYQLVISKNASNVYSLCVDSKFVGATASNKTTLSFSELLQDGNAAYQWTITLNNLNNADIANVGCDGRYLKRSSTSTALKFAAYASGAKPVQLYKLQN